MPTKPKFAGMVQKLISILVQHINNNLEKPITQGRTVITAELQSFFFLIIYAYTTHNFLEIPSHVQHFLSNNENCQQENVEIIILKQLQHGCLKMCCYTCKTLQKCLKKLLNNKMWNVFLCKACSNKKSTQLTLGFLNMERVPYQRTFSRC